MPKETLSTRMAVVEERCKLREQIIEKEFQSVNAKLDEINNFLRNGLSQKITRQIRNGAASDKVRFGMKPESRDKIVLWAMRIAVFSLAGKEGLKIILGG